MRPSFWTDRNAFVTGHTGFKGSWLTLWLHAMGAKTTGYSTPAPTTPSLFEMANVADLCCSHIGNVLDYDELRKQLEQSEAEIVFHLAAQPLVRASYQIPIETYMTNVIGTANVLQAARDVDSVRAIVIITTDKCYENKEWMWPYREDEPLGGHDPYSASKACAEIVTASYTKSFFHTPDSAWVASARAGNVIGGGDYAEDRLIVDLLAAIDAGQPVQIRNPASVRPWQHVLEPLRGYLNLGEQLLGRQAADFAGAWNFGPSADDAQPVSWICDRLTRMFGNGASWETVGGDHPHESTYLKLDSTKSQTLLNWHPRLHLEQALQWIVDWQQGVNRGEHPRDICLAQIAAYENLGEDNDHT